ncbi:MAG: hypothetical protein ACI8ZN_000823 [Bacteroidia bacterium]|jgi:hypothetical protein
MKHLKRLVEIMWLAIAAFAAVEGFISFRAEGLSQNTIIYVVVFVLAIAMYTLRKRQGRKSKIL